MEMTENDRLALGRQDVFLLKGTSGVGSGVKRRGTEVRNAGTPYQSSVGGSISCDKRLLLLLNHRENDSDRRWCTQWEACDSFDEIQFLAIHFEGGTSRRHCCRAST